MAVDGRALNRATLARQLLLRRHELDVEEAARQVVALQAQEPASPYLALWNRVAGFDPAAVDRALQAGGLAKATLMRITLHVVHADDLAALHTAMQPTLRAARLNDRRFTDTGLTADDADALVPGLLAFAATPRTVAELEAWCAEHVGEAGKRAWWALRSIAPLVHAPTGAPWTFGRRPSFVSSGRSPTGDPDVAFRSLVRRYLAAFGPGTVADVAQFALAPRARVAAVIEAMSDELEVVDGTGRAALYDVPDAPRPDADTPAPARLLPMWDSVLLVHADRSRVIPPALRKAVTRTNGDVLPTLLVDGYVAGVWRVVDGAIEATALTEVSDAAWDELEGEARSLLDLVRERDPRPYGRFDHWWSKLPPGEVRLLGA